MWNQVAATVAESLADEVSDVLVVLGALSVSLEDAGDQPIFEPKPGETPLWQETIVVGLFEPDHVVDYIEQSLKKRFGSKISRLHSAVLEDQVWERAWMEHFKPMQFGRRLWICPTGYDLPDPSAINVLLDPGLAFGTGTHPTTALCLEWLDGLDLKAKSVVDYGCGSGVLAVAALKLGASAALGLDIDAQALTASRDNAEKNDVASRLDLNYPNQGPKRLADIVVANILAGPLVELREDILAYLKPSGSLALSGVLKEQASNVQAAYAPFIDFLPLKTLDDWAILMGVKKPSL